LKTVRNRLYIEGKLEERGMTMTSPAIDRGAAWLAEAGLRPARQRLTLASL